MIPMMMCHPRRPTVGLLAALIVSTLANAQADDGPMLLSNAIEETTLLKKTAKPHQLVGDLAIRKGQRLVIERGARIEAAGGVQLIVTGELLVVGEGDDRVLMTARDRRKPWAGLRLIDAPVVTLEHLTIENAETGVEVKSRTRLDMDACVIRRCRTGIRLHDPHHEEGHTVANSVVAQCVEDGLVAAFCTDVHVTGSSFVQCGGRAIDLPRCDRLRLADCVFTGNTVALQTDPKRGSVGIDRCVFVKSRRLHIDHLTNEPLEARRCFWGTTDAAAIARLIRDGRDGFATRGLVAVTDSLTKPPELVGATLSP